MLSFWKPTIPPLNLLPEELFVSQVLAYPYVTVFSAKVQDFVQKRVVALVKLTLETDSPRLHTNLKHTVAGKKLIETKLFTSIFLEDIPILNNVYQTGFTLTYDHAKV
jgi:hypothetical protein